MTSNVNKVMADWARIGVAFHVTPAPRTPDLERLILRTAGAISHDPQLLVAAVSWLVAYPLLVARHRLAALLSHSPDFVHRPELGLLLDAVRQRAKTRHFDRVIGDCRPAHPARPLFVAQQENPVWRQAARSEASALARRWGLWCQAVEPKDDVIRPSAWIIDRNPPFYDRAVLRGDLRLSILAALQTDPGCGASELTLARCVAANRSAVRYALSALEQSCHVQRRGAGKRSAIELLEPRWLRAA